ncbi:hypothetical protein RRG08_037590 [Elysia crispata]|uniref:Band 7 domain-containing protein n=1 Tax=Elysia crispata TaxID=231223 RepID=A0AAE1DX41_9GAST|nr:hypothetical protein RRG08_037590 [Elysia crispata]
MNNELKERGLNSCQYHHVDPPEAGRVTSIATTATGQGSRGQAGPDDRGYVFGANESSHESGCCAVILTALSYLLVVLFFPISLCATIKVVQEYERAVIFRLGRLLPGGAKGPGIFFVMPCIEEYSKVDLRTVSFDVPPQEVSTMSPGQLMYATSL